MHYGTVEGVHKPISRLVQGTVTINAQNREQSFALLDSVLAQGCTAFDTAHTYSNGDNERTVGAWVRERGVRDQIVIIGKGAHPYNGRNRVTPEDIRADIDESLQRFGFDFIDLYLLHRDDPGVPVGPIVEALNDAHRAGKIGGFGGSNWAIERIVAANAYAHEHGLLPFAASSPNFSLAEQFQPPWDGCLTISGAQGAAARAYYRETGMPVFAWSSLAGGFLSGRFRRDNLDSMSGYFDKLAVESYAREPNFQRLDRVRTLADARGMTVPQIALAWVMSQPMNMFALVGSATGAEFQANAEAAAHRLTTDELAWLDLQAEAR